MCMMQCKQQADETAFGHRKYDGEQKRVKDRYPNFKCFPICAIFHIQNHCRVTFLDDLKRDLIIHHRLKCQ